ncbi:hypothetical protein PVX_121350 [Plasmodium vivax]|uniref:VIR protein n=1 Tax=Plasmodium vivax (strain Salvador I) TaxID=126793 RepID=A5KDP7_PLAVS|nr:hypothetical protein PVX_121350 [Plasmodium vivax]EDL42522.1 hypothetical protein PVX_121350 [Plasmodium vivax]|eukprot:XP_001608546.1 hypothetical protein [Plasmodium vivax Sal-1]
MDDLERQIREIPEIDFFNKLDSIQDSEDMNVQEYVKGCNHLQTYYIERYFRRIIKNYVLYDNCIKNYSKEKCCRFFKYWIHKEKNHYKKSYSNQSSVWEYCFPSLWSKLKETYNNSNYNCDIEESENYSYAVININAYLDELHSIKKFLWDSDNEPSDRYKCLIYNIKRNDYMKNIFMLLFSITNFSTIKKDQFKISEDCSLLKFFSYFPEICCPEETKTENLKPSSCECQETQLLIQKTDCPASVVKEIVEIPKSSPSTSPSQIVVPAILTFIGTLFLCYLLYNFTPIGSLLYTRIKKKNIYKNQEKGIIPEAFIKKRNDDYYQNSRTTGNYISYDPL